MEIEKIYRILTLTIGVAALLIYLAGRILFPDANHHTWLLCIVLPAIVALFSGKKEKHERLK